MNLNEQNLRAATDWLAQRDDILAKIVEQYGYPPIWSREPGFASLIHIILEQQVSLASAKAAFQRLQSFATVITPSSFLRISDTDLLHIGFSRQKKIYARGLAEALVHGNLSLESLLVLPDHEVRGVLKQFKGIGDWTADVYLLFCLGRPNILPKGDIALYEAMKVLKNLEKRPDYASFESLTSHWHPWRSVGARLLWHFYLCERGRRD